MCSTSAAGRRALLRRHSLGASPPAFFPALAPAIDRSRVLPLFLGRRVAILDLARRDIHNEFRELIWIAGALAAFGVSGHSRAIPT